MDEIIKCLSDVSLTEVLLSLGTLVAAIIFHWALYAFFKRVTRKDGFWKKLVIALRFPSLAIFLEIALVLSLNFLGIRDQFESFFEQTLNIIVILTVGWVFAAISHAFYAHFVKRYEKKEEFDAERRSMFTQILFLYRFVMFTIVTLTFGAVLMTFPHIRSLGVGILGSAGIAGIALGMAARPILLNFISGFQIAMTKTIKIGDAVFIEGDFCRIEAIHLTHVVARTWDLRRIVLPISFFIDKPFQNWDSKDPELLGTIFLYCDYNAPVDVIRKKVGELVESNPNYNGNVWRVHVTDFTEQTMQLRLIMTGKDAPTTFLLRADVREQLIAFLQKEYPECLPKIRYQEKN